MNKNFNQAWKYFAGGATLLGNQAFYEHFKTPANTLEFKNNLNTHFDAVKTKISELKQELSSSVDLETKTQLTGKINDLTTNLKNMESIHKKYINKFENGNVSVDSEASSNLYNEYKTEFQEAFSKADKKVSEILNLLDKTKNKFMEDNNIFNVINDFKEYLALCLLWKFV